METDLPLDSSALIQIFHGPSPMLPNIKTISWRFSENQNCMSILPFIGPKLENLFLEMDGGINNDAQSLLFQGLAHRLPTLIFLRLTSFGLAHHISTSLSTLISSLPKLINLELPPFFLTREVVAATAQLPLLTRLGYSKWMKAAENYHDSGMCFEFMPGSFLQLDTLSFASMPNRMAEILRSTDHVRRLRTVLLDCPAYNSPQEIENVFTSLGSCAHRLTHLHFVCCPVPQSTVTSSKESLSIDDIRPLFSCTRLKRFYLWGPHLVPLKDEDVVEMGKNWPAMRTLVLCPAPLVKRDVAVGFGILPSFAKSFPKLRELQLFFGREVSEFEGDLYPTYRFTELETLGLGLSRIPREKARDIGFLLASLCQRPPLIKSGADGGYRGHAPGSADWMAACPEIRSNMNLAFRIKDSFVRKFDMAGSAVEFRQGLSVICPSN